MSDVRITSGLTRYFGFGVTPGVLSTTTVQNSLGLYKESPYSSYQGIITGTGAVSATIVIQGTNEDASFTGSKSNWVTLGTITLSGTTTASDGFTSTAPWKYSRASVTAISGTAATVEVIMGV